MDFSYTEEQTLLRDAVRTLADERVAPRAAEIDRTGEFPQDLRELLASQDILALPFPEAYGGLGGDLVRGDADADIGAVRLDRLAARQVGGHGAGVVAGAVAVGTGLVTGEAA